MNNSEIILRELDKHLREDAELIIFGKSAIVLGFPTAPSDYASTMDVDGIIPMEMLEALSNNENFWDALEKTNEVLKPTGLYMTHIFQEDQIILTPDWLKKTVPLNLGLNHLKIQRPSTLDLILTKMMRGDDADLEDNKFLIKVDIINITDLETAYPIARSPKILEIEEIFLRSQKAVRKLYQPLETPHNGQITGNPKKTTKHDNSGMPPP